MSWFDYHLLNHIRFWNFGQSPWFHYSQVFGFFGWSFQSASTHLMYIRPNYRFLLRFYHQKHQFVHMRQWGFPKQTEMCFLVFLALWFIQPLVNSIDTQSISIKIPVDIHDIAIDLLMKFATVYSYIVRELFCRRRKYYVAFGMFVFVEALFWSNECFR